MCNVSVTGGLFLCFFLWCLGGVVAGDDYRHDVEARGSDGVERAVAQELDAGVIFGQCIGLDAGFAVDVVVVAFLDVGEADFFVDVLVFGAYGIGVVVVAVVAEGHFDGGVFLACGAAEGCYGHYVAFVETADRCGEYVVFDIGEFDAVVDCLGSADFGTVGFADRQFHAAALDADVVGGFAFGGGQEGDVFALGSTGRERVDGFLSSGSSGCYEEGCCKV